MKKVSIYFSFILIVLLIFVLGFSNQKSKKPNYYYQVYLDGEYLGTIDSKKSLENYITKQANIIRDNVKNYNNQITAINDTNEVLASITENKLGIYYNDYKSLSNNDKAKYIINNQEKLQISDLKTESLKTYLKLKLFNLSNEELNEMKSYYENNKIYLTSNNISTPNGIEIKRVLTYNDDTISIEKMYNKIIARKNCTIPGYVFTITDSNKKKKTIYVTDKDVFKDSIDTLAQIFIGEEAYNNYKEDNQIPIETTGEVIDNVYVQEDITYKAVNIPTDEVIYNDASELSKYLLYGNKYEENKVTVNKGDSIATLAFNNKISVEEFLISNPEYNNENNLLYEGKSVVIAKVNPQINIVEETYSVKDVEAPYNTVELYDSNMTQGDQIVSQEGENGIERVTQNVKSVNGQITYVEPVRKETIKSAVDKKITVGTKVIPNVGSTTSWGWPTNSGYTLSSRFGYRIAVFGEGDFHSGLDIAGTGYGSPVYATNNGVITTMKYTGTYGNHIIINHNNGYYTLYGHMSGFAKGLSKGSTVERGQVIGYVGSTGWATGPHLHYEIRTCEKYSCVTDPLRYY